MSWKQAEDWWCAMTGMKRRGHMERGTECPDAEDDLFSVDITTTNQALAFITKEMIDAEAHTEGNRIPIVVIFQNRKQRKDGFVVMRVKSWLELHGK